MNKSSFQPEYADVPLPTEVRAFYHSRLMSPEEVKSATARQPQQVREVTQGKWCLSGDVCPQMFELLGKLELSHFPVRITGFRSSSGMTYGVLTHQVARFQSRIVMSLSDPWVRQFLQAMADTTMVFLLGNDGNEDSLLFSSPVQPSMFLPLLAMPAEPFDGEPEGLVEETALVMSEMSQPATVPSLTVGHVIHHVSVSMLLPEVVNDAVVAAIQKERALCL